ncbi:MAG: ATP-dependent sacrificial sulfur transferase LarE [Gemmatimonadota bacterium]|nr:ATP-dependent sacrificial sulfur transferase LarE [Gemmatimonadota bacterium]
MAPPFAAAAPETGADLALAREQRLVDWLRARGRVAIGFSGGVDSAYLAVVAVDTLGRGGVLAIIGRSASYPAAQWEAARGVAAQFGVPVLEIDTDELHDPRYAANPSNRCYFCKTELWTRLIPEARARGFDVVADGTNADDRGDYRPGAQAGQEHAVASPLAEAGLTKADIRERSRVRGIPTWKQPSSPCLSSRLPYGTAVTIERLRQVEVAEEQLRRLGVTGDLRVRHHGETARVEIDARELAAWTAPEAAERVRAAVRAAGFAVVEIDPRGYRSGSLNILAGVGPQSGTGAAHAAPHGAPLSRD